LTRHLFLGDVQGCRGELERLLEKLAFDPTRDVLRPVGDLVNRGPDSLGALRLLRELDARSVLGNHDLHLLRVAAGERAPSPSDTFADVLEAPDRDELLAWLAAQPFVRAEDGRVQVHAGLHPLWRDPVAELSGRDPLVPDEATDFATRVRYCTPSGERPADDAATPPAPFAPWFEHVRPEPDRTVVFGHWAARGLVVRPGLRGLDTGCVWGGRLTAWIAEEDRLVDVPAERAWCGRT
jgi:bis(5'-nucleosyl)-tetraphosphatase (symmetrical)